MMCLDDPVDFICAKLATVPVLTSESEVDLGKRIQRGGSDAETAIKDLFEANLWLVVAIAKRFPNEDIHILDLIQEGILPSSEAGHKLHIPARGYRVSDRLATCYVCQQ